MDTVVLPTHTIALLEEAARQAADLLRAGHIVAIPTETVYGLAGNALDAEVVRRIFAVKGRPANNPVIVHVNSIEMARQCVSVWPEQAQKLAEAFWPGPLTLVLPRARQVPDVVTAGGPTVAIRWPRHPFVQKLVHACQFPLAAPSANLSGEISPTTAEHVARSLRGRIAMLVDGGPCNVGIESTVFDLSLTPHRILRPGLIHGDAIAAVIGSTAVEGEGPKDAPLRSPGLLERHYAPKARVLILEWKNDAELVEQLRRHNLPPNKTHILAHTNIPEGSKYAQVSVVPDDAEAFARALYAELHRADELLAVAIVVEAIPEEGAWRAVADRLRRASA